MAYIWRTGANAGVNGVSGAARKLAGETSAGQLAWRAWRNKRSRNGGAHRWRKAKTCVSIWQLWLKAFNVACSCHLNINNAANNGVMAIIQYHE